MDLIKKVKDKRELKDIPDSIVSAILDSKENSRLGNDEKIKNTRAVLRKYFSVFKKNKFFRSILSEEEILFKHISSKNRNYREVYDRILDDENTLIDLGAGLNGFSYRKILEFAKLKYVGIEAIGSFVDMMNNFFKENRFNAEAIYSDLLNLEEVLQIIKKQEKPRIILMWNVIDALEAIKRDYTKELITRIFEILEVNEKIVISYPTRTLTGKDELKAKRYWLINFLQKYFQVIDEFDIHGEKYLVYVK